ncbi:MAG: hypothetical protein IK076_03305 [Bacteroidales bacterium]|nr:hypothetical protein [Bacteroidales bacterium]
MSVTVRKDNKVTDTFTVKCHEVDAAKKLKPVAFMDMAQEMAYQAAAAMHFGYDELIVLNKAWVLSRMHFRFIDTPAWGDSLEIRTWHRGAFGPFFVRDFVVLGEDGRRRIEATSSWVVIDTVTRAMARPEDVLPKDDSSCSDFAIESPASKVMIPRGADPEYVTTRKVSYSDVDLVGHVNNARYVSWAMDCLEYEGDAPAVEEVEIVFHQESRPGDLIELYRVSEGDATYIEGRRDGRQTFCVKFKYSNL